jgi:tetratricopeptide (TPR) repeat protein
VWAHVNRAMTLTDMGRAREASEGFRTAFRLDPSQRTGQLQAGVNRMAGLSLAAVGDTAEARALFELLLDQGPLARADGLRSLALLEMARGRPTASETLLQEAIALNQATEQALSEQINQVLLGEVYRLMERTAAARAALVRADSIRRTFAVHPAYLASLASAFRRMRNADGAVQVLQQARAQVSPESVPLARAAVEEIRGEAALARGDARSAVQAFEAAHGLFSTPARLNGLAHAYALEGRFDEAESAYERLLSVPWVGMDVPLIVIEAEAALAELYRTAGDREAAERQYEAMIEKWPDADSTFLPRREAISALGRTGRTE